MKLAASFLLCYSALAPVLAAQDDAYSVSSGSGTSYLYGAELGNLSVRYFGEIRGSHSLGNPGGLAWRATTRELWTYDNSDPEEIGVIDPVAMTFTRRWVASTGNSEYVTDCAWHPATDRFLYLRVDSSTRRRTLSSFAPTSGTFATLATWETPLGVSGLDDLAIDGAGNLWFLGGAPFGLYLLEPGASAPRWFVSLRQSACRLTIDRSSGTFYVHTGPGSGDLGILDPSTGGVSIRGPFLGCGYGFVVLEGSCRPSVSRFGTGCAGSGGFTPQLNISGCYNPGGFVQLGVGEAPSGSVALLLFGLAPASFPIGYGCELLIAPVFQAPQIALPLFGSGGAGRGFTSLGLSIPASVPTAPLVAQAFVLDVQAPGGFTVTNGVRLD
jgi:hypothetical protein